jgi:hypothetical protein
VPTIDHPPQKTVLHVGCGTYAAGKLHSAFHSAGWTEIRLDIDDGVQPDIVASMTDMAPRRIISSIFTRTRFRSLWVNSAASWRRRGLR